MIAVLAILILQPVLAEDGPLRVVASGVGHDEVIWTLDGVEVARTLDREAAVIQVAAGAHELQATSAASGPWVAVARPDGVGDGAAFVPAWSAVHEAEPQIERPDGRSVPVLSLGLALVAAVLLAWPVRPGRRAKLAALFHASLGERRTKMP